MCYLDSPRVRDGSEHPPAVVVDLGFVPADAVDAHTTGSDEPALRACLHAPVHDEQLEPAAQRVRLHQLLDGGAVLGASGHHDCSCRKSGDVNGDGVLRALRAPVRPALVVERSPAV